MTPDWLQKIMRHHGVVITGNARIDRRAMYKYINAPKGWRESFEAFRKSKNEKTK